MTTTAELIARARAAVATVDAVETARRIADTDVAILDVREAAELAAGLIPGAIHVPRGLLEFAADPSSPGHDARLDPRAKLIVYCADGERSALAAVTLRELGYGSVAHLAGGLTAWRDAGFETARLSR